MTDKKRYTDRKARMARDPAYRAQVLRAQADSRARAVEARWAELAKQGLVCQHRYPAGRHCWKTYSHMHAGRPAEVVTVCQPDPPS